MGGISLHGCDIGFCTEFSMVGSAPSSSSTLTVLTEPARATQAINQPIGELDLWSGGDGLLHAALTMLCNESNNPPRNRTAVRLNELAPAPPWC